MNVFLSTALLSALCCAKAAANPSDPTTGLPVAPGFGRTGDPIKSYASCGKQAREAVYMANIGPGESDVDHENDWYARAIPATRVFTSAGGDKAFFKKDGTTVVRTAGSIVVYYRFTPGLSPSQMKTFGTTTTDDACMK